MNVAPSLDEAMNCYADGDDHAFEVIFRGLQPRLRAFLLRLGGSSSLADDLVQETFLRIHRARGSFARRAPVVPWAYAIARNVWLQHARSGARRSAREDPLGENEHEQAAAADADSEQVLVAKQTAQLVERVLGDLPELQREAFVLLRYEGLSVDEAASVAGATPTAMKLRAFRAYEALRAAFDSDPRREEKGHVRMA